MMTTPVALTASAAVNGDPGPAASCDAKSRKDQHGRDDAYEKEPSVYPHRRLLSSFCTAQDDAPQPGPKSEAGKVTPHSEGLHGYIGFEHEKLPADGRYSAGMGFYSAVWPLTDQPLANFQIGLPSAWITPDNSDNKDKPLAPKGTTGAAVEGAGADLGQRLPDRGGRTGLLGGQPLPLRPAQVQHERHAAMLRLRGRLAGLVLLLQQRGAAGQSARHRPTEQPAADSPGRAAFPRPSQRRVPRLHLDGAAVHRSPPPATRPRATRAGPVS